MKYISVKITQEAQDRVTDYIFDRGKEEAFADVLVAEASEELAKAYKRFTVLLIEIWAKYNRGSGFSGYNVIIQHKLKYLLVKLEERRTLKFKYAKNNPEA